MRLLWAAALVLPGFVAQAGVSFTSLYSFHVFPNGENPEAGLVQGSDGNLYGTTSAGGTNGHFDDHGIFVGGTVFKIGTNGGLTTLHSFTGGNDGGFPEAGLVQGSDGNLYGTTYYGGTNGAGTVFKISTDGTLTTLHSFAGGNDGGCSAAGLVQGSDGNFYGTGFTVFKITTNGALTTLYPFFGANYSGELTAGLVQGSDGNFYGTTPAGGTNGGHGTVFKISTNGALTILHSFSSGTDGANPQAGLVQGSDGNLYGTTYLGGTNGYGTVFKISIDGALTTLYSFTGTFFTPNPSGLVQGNDGNLYGTTRAGGTNGYFQQVGANFYFVGYGSVFKISTNGALTTLYSFTGGNDGVSPYAGLVLGSDGNFYGTTEYNGVNVTAGGPNYFGAGTVFKISTNGVLTTLYSFTGGNDGSEPYAGLVQGNDGYLYGTTSDIAPGGGYYGDGTVFKISTRGALTTLYAFGSLGFTGVGSPLDGAIPRAALVQGSDGNFYGTTSEGGPYGSGYGTVFKISSNGALTTLYSFTGGNDGAYPSGLAQGSDGNFYGTTPGGYGTVFKISTHGALTTLYSFTGSSHSLDPSGLVRGSDGNFYGTTVDGGPNGDGTVFKISTNGALTTLHSFNGTDGANPYAGLVQASDGNFYGTTSGGGTTYAGTVFKISTNGDLTTLYSFTAGNDGSGPYAGLVQGSDGNFYGTTCYGGTNGAYSTLFKISANGVLTTLYSFTGGKDGAYPYAPLVQGSDGNFYGTTYGGGVGGVGTVFRLAVVPAAPTFQAVTLTNGLLSLTWSTDAGGMYQLQYNSDLSSSNWTNLGSAVTATGGTLSAIGSVTNGPRRFYRVVLLP